MVICFFSLASKNTLFYNWNEKEEENIDFYIENGTSWMFLVVIFYSWRSLIDFFLDLHKDSLELLSMVSNFCPSVESDMVLKNQNTYNTTFTFMFLLLYSPIFTQSYHKFVMHEFLFVFIFFVENMKKIEKMCKKMEENLETKVVVYVFWLLNTLADSTVHPPTIVQKYEKLGTVDAVAENANEKSIASKMSETKIVYRSQKTLETLLFSSLIEKLLRKILSGR